MITRARDSPRKRLVRRRGPAFSISLVLVVVGVLTSRAQAVSAVDPPAESDGRVEAVYFPAKLKVLRATVRDGALEAVLSISGRATGTITIDYQAAGQFSRSFAATGPAQAGEKRVAVTQPLVGRQRSVRTGIINASFAGDATTQADSTRLRVAKRRTDLKLNRATFEDGRLSVAGSIDPRVTGTVHLRASYRDLDGSIALWTGRAAIAQGAWALDEKLPLLATFDPNAYLTVRFTGQKDAVGGPYRGEQIGRSLGNLEVVPFIPPAGDDDPCASAAEDECLEPAEP